MSYVQSILLLCVVTGALWAVAWGGMQWFSAPPVFVLLGAALPTVWALTGVAGVFFLIGLVGIMAFSRNSQDKSKSDEYDLADDIIDSIAPVETCIDIKKTKSGTIELTLIHNKKAQQSIHCHQETDAEKQIKQINKIWYDKSSTLL